MLSILFRAPIAFAASRWSPRLGSAPLCSMFTKTEKSKSFVVGHALYFQLCCKCAQKCSHFGKKTHSWLSKYAVVIMKTHTFSSPKKARSGSFRRPTDLWCPLVYSGAWCPLVYSGLLVHGAQTNPREF